MSATRRDAKGQSPARLGDLLGSVARAARAKAGPAAALVAAWPDVAGPAAGRASRVGRVSGTTVVVHCDSSAWAHELGLLAEVLAARLSAAVPPGDRAPWTLRFRATTDVAPTEFVPGPSGGPRRRPGPPPAERPADRALADRLTRAMTDADVATAVASVIRAAAAADRIEVTHDP